MRMGLVEAMLGGLVAGGALFATLHQFYVCLGYSDSQNLWYSV